MFIFYGRSLLFSRQFYRRFYGKYNLFNLTSFLAYEVKYVDFLTIELALLDKINEKFMLLEIVGPNIEKWVIVQF